MMQNIRKRTRIVLFVVLAGFLLLIFFQWGLNIMGIQKGPKIDIAKIDGVPIDYPYYLRFLQAQKSEARTITQDEIWSALIDEIMWHNLLIKERIRVTDDEIWAIIKTNPPRPIYESEYMRDEKGEFDFNKYYELLSSPQSRPWLLEYEYSLRDQLPKEKLRSLLATMGWVSPYEDSLFAAWQTTYFDISSISIPLYRLRPLIQITEDEIAEHYSKHIDEFTQPEARILKYVFFERIPSTDDTLEARERLDDFLIRVNEEGEDFLEVAKEVSDNPEVEYRFKEESVLPVQVRDAYRRLRDGAVSQVISTPEGFEVIKRIGRGSIYRVQANIEVSPSTVSDIHDRIVSFKETSQDHGFDTAVQDFDLVVRRTYPLYKGNINFPVRNVEALTKFLARAPKGKLGGPFSSLGGYYVFIVDSLIPETVPVLADVAPRIKAELARDRLRSAMDSYLQRIADELGRGRGMKEMAISDTLIVFSSDLKNTLLLQIKESHGEEFAGVVASLEPGQISSPLVTDWAGYIIRCDKKRTVPIDSMMIGFLQTKRQLRLQYLTQSIFTPARIEDHRDDFFE